MILGCVIFECTQSFVFNQQSFRIPTTAALFQACSVNLYIGDRAEDMDFFSWAQYFILICHLPHCNLTMVVMGFEGDAFDGVMIMVMMIKCDLDNFCFAVVL